MILFFAGGLLVVEIIGVFRHKKGPNQGDTITEAWFALLKRLHGWPLWLAHLVLVALMGWGFMHLAGVKGW